MQKTFEVSGAVELEVRLASGDISVDPTLDGSVEVELTAHDEESQRLVDDARIELRDNHVTVDVPQKRGFSFFGGRGITCRIRCPEGSKLTAKTKSADVTARGTIGGLTVATASGDVEANRVSGSVNVKSASGDATAREITGGVNIQSASGDIELEVVHGPANVTSVSGDVTIGEAYDDVSANTVSGDQDHGAVMRGNVTAQSVSGDVRIAVRRGSKVFLDCNTMSGDTSSELDVSSDAPTGDGPLVEIRAKTISGDIRITRAAAPASNAQEVQA